MNLPLQPKYKFLFPNTCQCGGKMKVVDCRDPKKDTKKIKVCVSRAQQEGITENGFLRERRCEKCGTRYFTVEQVFSVGNKVK